MHAPRTTLVLTLLLLGCGEAVPNPALDPQAGSLLLVTIDTLRVDHLGCCGFDQPTSPNLDRLAREGVLFSTTIIPVPETDPAHVTLFTSQYPVDHRVTRNGYPLAEEAVTLAEVLRDRGYRTAAFVGVRHLDSEGYRQGFQTFRGVSRHHSRPAAEVNKEALTWLEQVQGPFFLWVHYWDPHFPYLPLQPEFRRLHRTEPGRLEASMALLSHLKGEISRRTGLERTPPGFRPWFRQSRKLGRERLKQELFESLSPSERHRIRQLYRGEIRGVDAELGRLLGVLHRTGWVRKTTVAVTADHGETLDRFLDRGSSYAYDHGESILDEEIRVPLLLYCPGELPRGLSLERQVRSLDVAPTLLELCRLPPPPEFHGRSLVRLIRGELMEEYPAYLQTQPARYEGLRRDGIKLVQDLEEGTRSACIEPSRGEENWSRLSPDQASDAVDWQLLDQWLRRKSDRGEPEVRLNRETLEMLEALGYLSEPSSSPSPGS